MSDGEDERSRSHWEQLLEEITERRSGDDVTIEVLDRDFGDALEVERLPLASLDYDPKDDAAVIAVGGRDGRLPVVLRHIVAHPRQIVAEAVSSQEELVIEIVDDEGQRTFVTLHPAGSDRAGAGRAR